MRLEPSTVADMATKATVRASGYAMAGDRQRATKWNNAARQLNYAAAALSLAMETSAHA